MASFREAAARTRRAAGTARRWFRRWRHTRPFWAGVLTIAGGAEILLLPLVPLPILIHEGIAGVSGLLMGALMIVMGLSMWFAPQFRVFAGIATILFSLTSFVTSNLGGMLIGMLLGLAGGPLAIAWTTRTPPATPPSPTDGPADTTQAGPAAQPRPDVAPAATLPDSGDGSVVEPPAADDAAATTRIRKLPLLGLAAVLVGATGPATAPRVMAAPTPVVNAVIPTMHARTITMVGLSFDGVVELSTADGPLRTLSFSMSRVTMRGYSLRAPGGLGAAAVDVRVQNLTLDSNVSFYTTRMAARLGGVVPVVFTPDAPPPLVLPVMSFTDFTATQVFVRSDTLTTDGGLHIGAGLT